MTVGKRYEIRTPADFMSVPRERLDLCLSEFAMAVKAAAATFDLLSAVSQEMYEMQVAEWRLSGFTWIDDDQRNLTVSLRTPVTHGAPSNSSAKVHTETPEAAHGSATHEEGI
jgi:hypothetical protein